MKKVTSFILCLVLMVTLCLSNYSGIVQAAGKAPNEIAGLKLWYDASGLELENQTKVSIWPNKAGDNKFDAKQSSESDQPIFITEGKVNGKPAVRFSSKTMLEVATQFYMEEMTIFIVVYIDTIEYDPDCNQIFSRLTGEQEAWKHNWWFNIDNGAMNFGYHDGSDWRKAGGDAPAVEENESYIFTGVKDSEGGLLFLNGEEEAYFNGTDEPYDCDAKAYIGRSPEISTSECLNGDICEIIVFDKGLTSAEIKDINNYLKEKYEIGNVSNPEITNTPIPTITTSAQQTTAAATATTATGTVTQPINNDSDENDIIPLIIIGSVVVIAIGVAAIVVIKKKKSK